MSNIPESENMFGRMWSKWKLKHCWTRWMGWVEIGRRSDCCNQYMIRTGCKCKHMHTNIFSTLQFAVNHSILKKWKRISSIMWPFYHIWAHIHIHKHITKHLIGHEHKSSSWSVCDHTNLRLMMLMVVAMLTI